MCLPAVPNRLLLHLAWPAAVELGRTTQDWVYLAAALEGFASAKVLAAAITHGAFAINQSRWGSWQRCRPVGIH